MIRSAVGSARQRVRTNVHVLYELDSGAKVAVEGG